MNEARRQEAERVWDEASIAWDGEIALSCYEGNARRKAVASIAGALKKARNDALEEAAVVAERWHDANAPGRAVAAAIRAMKEI